MISRRSMFLAGGTALLTAPSVAEAQDIETVHAASDVQADLDTIWSTLREVSPEPFRTCDPAAVEVLYRRTRDGLTRPLTTRAAWLAIAPVLGSLNDGHVALGFPGELNTAALRFPLSFAVSPVDGGLIIAGDRTQTVANGARVLAIEGVPAVDFLRTTLAAHGAQTLALRRARVTGSGAWTAVAMFGDKPAYRLRWRAAAGMEHEAQIGGSAAPRSRHPTDPYSFRWAREGVGLIDYRRCEDLSRFRVFLDSTFTQLHAARATALIIDVRHNGGGDSNLKNMLWSYAQSRPFKQFGATVERSNRVLKQVYGRDKYVRVYGERAWAAADGAVLREGAGADEDLVIPRPMPVRFTGPVYLLISAATFSSGMSCALAAKDYGLATLVGEETGEPASGTGELYEMVTPNLGLHAYITTKVFLAPKPRAATEGVRPDVFVPTTEVARRAPDADAVLERTLALIAAPARSEAVS